MAWTAELDAKLMIIANPSFEYEKWRDQPCRIVRELPGDDFSPAGYVDVKLTGDMDKGLILRIRAASVQRKANVDEG